MENEGISVAEKVSEFSRNERQALEKLVEEGKMTDKDANDCNALFTRFYKQKISTGVELDWSKISPLPSDNVLNMNDIEGTQFSKEEIADFFNKLVVLKLNGGVGTSMGCSYPKSCIEVRDGLTFLHMVLKQISAINSKYGVNIPLVFMNSDRTEKTTKEVIENAKKELGVDADVYYFNQPMYPRGDVETLLPTSCVSSDNPEFWYPPGHASVLTSFKNSGMAEKFAEMKKEWVFISNADNLGAIPDGELLGTIIKCRDEKKEKTGRNYHFFMEATPKTKLDIKGGTPVLYEGEPFLLEAAQIPKGKEEEMCDLTKYTYFNTGNLWINLQGWIEKGSFDLPIIYNPKTIHGDDGDAKIVQLEMGVGAALSYFSSVIISVSRKRFIPVKFTCDLLRLQSDLFIFHDDGVVEPRVEKLPEVILSDEFKTVDEFKKRIQGHVSLINAKKLKLIGNVIIKGDVTIVGKASYSWKGDIPLKINASHEKKKE